MRLDGTELQLSATDLANHLACGHLSALDRKVARRELAAPHWSDPALELLRKRGQEHEAAYVRHLRDGGKRVEDLNGLDVGEARRRTEAALRAGVDVIVQAALVDGRWNGRADVLERVERPSALGAWSYDVVDTKLAQETRGGTVLQLCLYADLLTPLQGAPAERMAVVKPGADFPREEFRFAEFRAYYRLVRARLEAFVARDGSEPYPEPVPHCDVCRWWSRCDGRRHADDHLSLVAGMTRLHADELRRQGSATLAALARATPLLREAPERGHREAFERLQGQAAVQLRGREEGRPVHELLEPEPGRGLARLPEPSPGDLFLDFEGDPFVSEGGLEYLLGYAFHDDSGKLRYEPLWALERAAEKPALERFLDLVHARLARHPGLHVYHYAAYEPAALKRLASRHATREAELDVLLRGERFVDLFGVTRQGLRASVESYSLKPLEAFTGYARAVKLREEASPALQRVSAALELGTPTLISRDDLAAVEGYNRDDCLSLVSQRTWLEARRAELVASGAAVARPPLKDGSASDEREVRSAEVQALFDALVAGVPAGPAERDEGQRARWLLAHLLDYFQREDRVAWWEFFARRDADDEELVGDRKALVGLTFVGLVAPESPRERTPTHRYRFPPQEVSIDVDDTVRDLRRPADDDDLGTVRALDLAAGTIDIKKTGKSKGRHPAALHVHDRVPPGPLPGALQAFARWVVEHGLEAPSPEHRAARDLLLRLPPRLGTPASGTLAAGDEPLLAAGKRLVLDLGTPDGGGVLALQGPPGSGKTHNGARMIVALARAGKRVGVAATSHKVIRNLLEEVLEAAAEERFALEVTHKFGSRTPMPTDLPRNYHGTQDPDEALHALSLGHVVGGVAWLWASEAADSTLDHLFVDEAGQMALAPVLACARAATNLVLLGDPRQLQQPQRGAHPEGADVSALDHLLGEHATIAPGQGLFLAETWRLP
ncbi:MAG TPA: TM0106 family RecB-like putative nuclease, partial [Planctomycetota bacterium]